MAREGLRLNLTEAKDGLLDAIDLPTHVRKNPLTALLVAAAGGVALSGLLMGVIRKHGGPLAAIGIASKSLKGLVTSQLLAKAFSQLPFARNPTSKSSRDSVLKIFDSLRL
jgi:hypothetical protein